MAGHDIIVIGGSAGSVEVLVELARGLPPGLPAAVFVVCHFPAGAVSVLPQLLSKAGPLLARHAREGEPIYPGHVYVAPPDFHLLVEPGVVRLSHGPRENHHRPAIDPLFRSAARAYGRRVVGVILTGALFDGVAGLLAVRAAGGVAVVQDPTDALVASMPRAAREVAGADHVVPAARLAGLLGRLVHEPVATARGVPMADPAPPPNGPADPLEEIPRAMARDFAAQANGDRRGALAVMTCPECGGALWQLDQDELIRFSCHVGHAYQAEVLLAEQAASLEAALWTAVRTFREKAVLARQLAGQERARGRDDAARRFEEDAGLADRYGVLIQQILTPAPAEAPAEPPPGAVP